MKTPRVRVKVSNLSKTPSREVLEKAGWTVEATPDPTKTDNPLADDGRKASDKPSNAKVLTDHKAPVTARDKKSETIIRREEIIESDSSSAVEETEEVSSNPFGGESNVFAALRVAELEEGLGLTNAEEKLARVAELENTSLERLNERISTLESVKEAGLASRPKVAKTQSLPRPSSFPQLKSASTEESVPDEAIF